ncbi:MAG TPA: c-type cytochrome biogenesis protein CcsB [Nitrospirota bacterium]
MNKVLYGVTLFLYFLASFHYLLYLINQRESIGKVCRITAIAGFAMNTLAMLHLTFYSGHVPLTNLRESLFFMSWAIMFIYIILEYRMKVIVMGAFIVPLAFLCMLVSVTLPEPSVIVPAYLSSAWLGVHTSFAFLAYAAFTISFATSVMYIIQERQLKHKHPGTFYHRLPPIEMLDELAYKGIALGFPLLTLAIVTGAIWANSAWGQYWGWEPKEIWALITWFIYAAYLHMRLVAGWRGRKAAYLAIAGFGIVMFTFLGITLLLPGKHAFK